MPLSKADIIAKLQRDILPLQGYKSSLSRHGTIKLGPINDAFPNGIFPTGAIHELIISKTEHTASTLGFVTGIIGKLSKATGVTLWISCCRQVFPPGLSFFGIEADKLIFIDLKTERDCFWAMEEALKCEGLTGVVCETRDLSFTASRRFQLAVEQSGVTGFLLRHSPRNLAANACIARWKISSLNSQSHNGLPGIGFPRWNVALLKIRNGRPGSWEIEFASGEFKPICKEAYGMGQEPFIAKALFVKDQPGIAEEQQKKAG